MIRESINILNPFSGAFRKKIYTHCSFYRSRLENFANDFNLTLHNLPNLCASELNGPADMTVEYTFLHSFRYELKTLKKNKAKIVNDTRKCSLISSIRIGFGIVKISWTLTVKIVLDSWSMHTASLNKTNRQLQRFVKYTHICIINACILSARIRPIVQAFFAMQFDHTVANTSVHTKCAGCVQAQSMPQNLVFCA